MAYDLVIKNGTVVDGTGAPRFARMLRSPAIASPKSAKSREGGKRVIDASDLIVVAGFRRPAHPLRCADLLGSYDQLHFVARHHFGRDGQLRRRRRACKPEAREIAAWDLTNVEAIPYESLNKGVTWDWETFPEFLDAAQKRGSAINLGFLAPLTPFRHYVMGKESMERAATAEETKQIAALLGEAMAAGALGFSTTTLKQHIGYHGHAPGLPTRQQRRA